MQQGFYPVFDKQWNQLKGKDINYVKLAGGLHKFKSLIENAEGNTINDKLKYIKRKLEKKHRSNQCVKYPPKFISLLQSYFKDIPSLLYATSMNRYR